MWDDVHDGNESIEAKEILEMNKVKHWRVLFKIYSTYSGKECNSKGNLCNTFFTDVSSHLKLKILIEDDIDNFWA